MGLIASYSPVVYEELLNLNSGRGGYGYSVTALDAECNCRIQVKAFDRLSPFDLLGEEASFRIPFYFMGHVQPPSGKVVKDRDSILPASGRKGFHLYFHGHLHPEQIHSWFASYNFRTNSEAGMLLEFLLLKKEEDLAKQLETIIGPFACILIRDGYYIKLFRNRRSDLFLDRDLNISSVSFPSAENIEPGKIYSLDLAKKSVTVTDSFEEAYIDGDFSFT